MSDCIEKEKRTTTDIYLIAAFLCQGARLLPDETDWTDKKHVKLTVEGDAKLLDTVEDDWYNDCLLKRFSNRLRELKSIVNT